MNSETHNPQSAETPRIASRYVNATVVALKRWDPWYKYVIANTMANAAA